MRIAVACILFITVGCNRDSSSAPEPVEPDKPTLQTTKVAIAQLEAENKLLQAMQKSVGAMVTASMTKADSEQLDAAKFLKEGSSVTTFLFSGNNHGERIDCGCKKRPLGGLARRQTLVEHAKSTDTDVRQKWWGKTQPADSLYLVDSGDMFFKTTMLRSNEPAQRELSLYDAQSVAAGTAKLQYDAVNVGAHDLALGLETLQALYKSAGIEPLSANLYQDGEPVFDRFRIVERAGQKIAFVGLLKDRPRDPKYYKDLGVDVRNAADAYGEVMQDVLKQSPDMVVLLSNLGIAGTQTLLKAAKQKPTVAIVSNTNRLTREPDFVDGVPIVEPMSRGKHLGRIDLLVNGDSVEFANSRESASELLVRYGRAWRNYLGGRIRYNNATRKVAEVAYQQAARDTTSQQAEELPEPSAKLEAELNKANKQLPVLAKGRVGSSAALIKESLSIESFDTQKSAGDDFIVTNILPVDIKIPEAKAIKRVIDKRESARPQKK